MPFFDEPMSPMWGKGQYHNAAVQRWADRIADGHAFVVVTPEYNHGYPARPEERDRLDLSGMGQQADWLRQLRQHRRGPRDRATASGGNRDADVADSRGDPHPHPRSISR